MNSGPLGRLLDMVTENVQEVGYAHTRQALVDCGGYLPPRRWYYWRRRATGYAFDHEAGVSARSSTRGIGRSFTISAGLLRIISTPTALDDQVEYLYSPGFSAVNHFADMPLTNYTIDDSQWATPALTLSAGWNMLRVGGANEFISPDEVDVMAPLLPEFWNQSVSWTTSAQAANTLHFVGTDIWAYGLAGPLQGGYAVVLDNETIGTYTAYSDQADYAFLLFAAHDLRDGTVHSLSLVNADRGSSLAFDYAVVQTGQQDPSLPAASQSSGSLANPSASSPSPSPWLADKISQNTSSTAAGSGMGLGNLTDAADGVVGLEPQTTWSAAQLAALAQPYTFHWSPAAYFVCVFASLAVGLFAIGTVHYLFPSIRGLWTKTGREIGAEARVGSRRQRDTRQGSVQSGESYLITEHEGNRRTRRPNTRLLDALRKGKISNPLPSDDGHSLGGDSRGPGRGGTSHDAYAGGRTW